MSLFDLQSFWHGKERQDDVDSKVDTVPWLEGIVGEVEDPNPSYTRVPSHLTTTQ